MIEDRMMGKAFPLLWRESRFGRSAPVLGRSNVTLLSALDIAVAEDGHTPSLHLFLPRHVGEFLWRLR